MSIEDAVEQTIEECIREGILAEFLVRNRAEAKAMSIYEYDEEKHMRQTREEGYEEGLTIGYATGQNRLLKLTSCMSADGELELIPELEQNKEFLEEMYKKYNL